VVNAGRIATALNKTTFNLVTSGMQQRTGPRLLAMLSLVVSTLSIPPAWATSNCTPSSFVRAKPLVIAHASSTYFGPANTIVAMREALKAGADALDADIRITADGVLVAAHDDALRSTTGVNASVSTLTYAELRKLDVARSWKNPKGKYALRGKGVTIPTIKQILLAFPDRRMSLEFKVTGGEQSLCDLLRQLKRTNDVWVGSAGDAAVDRFKPLCPEVVTTVTDAMVPIMQAARANNRDWCATVPIGQPPFYRSGGSWLTKESVQWSHDHGLATFTWTVDDPDDLALVKRVGADGVYTGRPDLARKIFDRG
jgi:glycerophosphoryl diester phosphodiesterase